VTEINPKNYNRVVKTIFGEKNGYTIINRRKDPKGELLSKIFEVIRSRRIKKEMAFENWRFSSLQIEDLQSGR
jgi:hypothetical protein